MVGKELRRLRDERSLSPTQLARLSDVSRARIYAIEDDVGGHPTLDTLHKLALGLSAWRDGTSDSAEFRDVFQSLVTAAGYPIAQAPLEGEPVTTPVPEPLAESILEILENWPRWTQAERETTARLLDVASDIGRPDPPTMAHDEPSESRNGITGFVSIIVRLNELWPAEPVLIPSRPSPAPTRELAYAGR